ncbi:ZIP family metal transporter [Halarchaeum nitratireducens]|uniref:ZIP family metal transporter n=1 Tax=Halarchaeum nitratireducens TaxID=489913 RepID=A0A830GAE3_9EURY|nr:MULTISPECIES: ZIP family metal transporter [Halarchaeum]MBP2250751.1 ZIP family zinc transporter [Halarchaeum solikamskense]GGN16525.1 ZIP family metal transporter [Halarchaeum nitratireducens]
MDVFAAYAFVFVAGLVTCLATGIGAFPFFVVDDVSERWTVALWGLASGIMLAASGFGLLREGLALTVGLPAVLVAGVAVGVALVVVSNAILDRLDVGGHEHSGEHDHEREHEPDTHLDPEAVAEGDAKKLALILGVLTVHSFPEGVAIGVSFAEMGLQGGVPFFGLSVPLLALVMTVAISVHNVPEGLAISIPLKAMDVSKWRMVGAAVFSSLPQPIGAVIAFAFVTWAYDFLPFGYGFAAGAMIYLVLTEFVPEALEAGRGLDGHGYLELALGVVAGFAVMVPLLFV